MTDDRQKRIPKIGAGTMADAVGQHRVLNGLSRDLVFITFTWAVPADERQEVVFPVHLRLR